jgi:hypothetical protein
MRVGVFCFRAGYGIGVGELAPALDTYAPLAAA